MFEKFKPNTEKGEAAPQRPNLLVQYVQLENTEKAYALEAKEAIARVEEVIESIDEKVLFDIYREYFGRSGNDQDSFEGTISPLKTINVFFNKQDKKLGYVTQQSAPNINAAALSELSDDDIINTVIHEYLHELTTQPVEEIDYEYDDGLLESEQIFKSGVSRVERYYRYQPDDLGSEDIDEAFTVISKKINEGITQILTDDIHAEYTKRVGVGGQSLERKNRQETGQSVGSYGREQLNVLIYIAWLSSLTGLPEEVVKQSVIRTYFRNGQIVPEEIKDLLPGDIKPGDILASKIMRELDHTSFDVYALDAMRFYVELSEEQKNDFQQKLWKLKEKYNQSLDLYENQ